jgi:hypothetical protein
MNRNELLNNIKAQFKKLMFATENYTCTTVDGKNLIVLGGTDIATGLEIYEVNADGTQIPLENGDYKLMDGRSIMITDNLVSEVKMPEAPAAEVEAPAEEVEMCGTTIMEVSPDEISEVEDEMPEIEDEMMEDKGLMAKRIEALESQIAEIMNMLSGTMKKATDIEDKTIKMSEQIIKLSNEPAGEKANVGKKMVQDVATKNSVTMDEIREIAKKINKN